MADIAKGFQVGGAIEQYRESLLFEKERTTVDVALEFHPAIPLPFVFHEVKIHLLGSQLLAGKKQEEKKYGLKFLQSVAQFSKIKGHLP